MAYVIRTTLISTEMRLHWESANKTYPICFLLKSIIVLIVGSFYLILKIRFYRSVNKLSLDRMYVKRGKILSTKVNCQSNVRTYIYFVHIIKIKKLGRAIARPSLYLFILNHSVRELAVTRASMRSLIASISESSPLTKASRMALSPLS